MRRRLLALMLPAILILVLWGSVGQAAAAEEHHGHKAFHDGVLNVIGKELAHAEVLIVEDSLEVWFVGGGQDTGRSVHLKAAEIPLVVKIPGQGQKKLILKADPMKLAGEKMGYCSHFVARADWLKGVKEFEATGSVVIKGVKDKLIIHYPEGYDPLHKHGHEDHEKEKHGKEQH
jgi:hypothetical protein